MDGEPIRLVYERSTNDKFDPAYGVKSGLMAWIEQFRIDFAFEDAKVAMELYKAIQKASVKVNIIEPPQPIEVSEE